MGTKVIKSALCAAGLSLLLLSCVSVNKKIIEPLDYSDKDIVESEIQRINSYLEFEPVRAMWRAILLGNQDVIDRCIKNVETQLSKSIEEKKYFDAKKYYKSLESAGWKNDKYSLAAIDDLIAKDIPGISKKNQHAPKSIGDCIDATVTVLVDRGVKVQNGAGYADVVIGSGFFIDSRGYIVTNHHVIESMVDPKYEGYSRLYIKQLEDPDTKIPAKVIGYDPILDLALLKTEITPKYVLNLNSSKDLHVGDKVSAIGTPIGLEGTLTSGIISSTDRKLLSLGNVFQIDAAINSGNSGGPLIDSNMNVQAVVFAGMLRYQGLNFAIPVEYLKQVLNSMYSNGEVVHTWTGCYGHTKRNGKKKVGVEIQYVMPGGSAFISGLRSGDVIYELDGNKITSIEDMNYILMAYERETMLKCKYLTSDGSDRECKIYLDKRSENPGKEIYESDLISNAMEPLFGMKLKSSSTLNKNSYTIEKIIQGSSADEMSFSENDSVQIRDVSVDDKNNAIYVQLYTKRQKKGFLDIVMTMATLLDSPYYF